MQSTATVTDTEQGQQYTMQTVVSSLFPVGPILSKLFNARLTLKYESTYADDITIKRDSQLTGGRKCHISLRDFSLSRNDKVLVVLM